MKYNLVLFVNIFLMLAFRSEANSFRNGISRSAQNFQGRGRQIARRFQSIEAPTGESPKYNSIFAPSREHEKLSPEGRIFSSWFSSRYPYGPINAYLPEDEYIITDYVAGTSIMPFRPKFYTLSYPFNVPAGWKVYDPIALGVNPPLFPEDYEGINYQGYWYGCPSNVNLDDPEVWQRGYKLFTMQCKYFYYF